VSCGSRYFGDEDQRDAGESLADWDDPAVCDRALLGDRVWIFVPASGLQPRDDISATSVGFSGQFGNRIVAPRHSSAPSYE